MARFIRVPTGDDRIILVNTERIESVVFDPKDNSKEDPFALFFHDHEGEIIVMASFDTKAEMEAFLDASFLLFNK